MYKISTLNKISPIGLANFTDNYSIESEVSCSSGILVRSQDMHEMDFDESLLAIARAGAGVNNIPLDKCADQGIVVFNTPGANANAVKELVLAGLLLAADTLFLDPPASAKSPDHWPPVPGADDMPAVSLPCSGSRLPCVPAWWKTPRRESIHPFPSWSGSLLIGCHQGTTEGRNRFRYTHV